MIDKDELIKDLVTALYLAYEEAAGWLDDSRGAEAEQLDCYEAVRAVLEKAHEAGFNAE